MTSYQRFIELRDECIAKAEAAEAAAVRRSDQLLENARASVRSRVDVRKMSAQEFERHVRNVMLDGRKNDAVWKSHVADNQWYISKATMYGVAVNGELLIGMLAALPIPSDRQIFSSR